VGEGQQQASSTDFRRAMSQSYGAVGSKGRHTDRFAPQDVPPCREVPVP